MQSPLAGTGVLQSDAVAAEDDVDIAAVDEILSQHSNHSPAIHHLVATSALSIPREHQQVNKVVHIIGQQSHVAFTVNLYQQAVSTKLT